MDKEEKFELARIIAGAVLLAAALLAPVEGLLRLALYLAPYLLLGYRVLWEALEGIFKGRVLDENFLMAVASLGALLLGEYPEAVAVMLFYMVGELFEDIAVEHSRRSISELMDIRPDHAAVLRQGAEYIVSPEQVAVGETIIVKPGEKIPLDGVIVRGSTTVNTAALTGESLPRDCGTGENVISGTVNLTGLIEVRVTAAFGESTVAKILELVETSSQRKAKSESFITRFARYYTPCVVAAAAALAVIPSLVTGEWSVWAGRALIFLVVSCPCALVVSVPLSFFAGIGGASRRGILIKGSNYLEALSQVDTVVFDKTGTLTQGVFEVTAVHPKDMSPEELLDIAALAESRSNHPIAASVVRAHGGHLDMERVGDIREIAGMGLEAVIDGRRVYAGNTRLMETAGVKWPECSHIGTVIHVAMEGEYCGHIVIADRVKPDSAQAVKSLKAIGVRRTVMLTGDSEQVGLAVGEELGIDSVRAGLMPEDKVAIVETLLAEKPEGSALVFVGDGVNDAPVLTRCDVGVAMGALGSDAAIEAADVVLMDDKPGKVALAVGISRRTMSIVRQNIVFSLGVKALVLVLGATGHANMWFAVLADVGVLILAVMNAMRAMGGRARS